MERTRGFVACGAELLYSSLFNVVSTLKQAPAERNLFFLLLQPWTTSRPPQYQGNLREARARARARAQSRICRHDQVVVQLPCASERPPSISANLAESAETLPVREDITITLKHGVSVKSFAFTVSDAGAGAWAWHARTPAKETRQWIFVVPRATLSTR